MPGVKHAPGPLTGRSDLRRSRALLVVLILAGTVAIAGCSFSLPEDTDGSIALIPFHSGDKWLGSWFIGRNEPSVFEPRLLRSYQSMAQQAAVVMDNIRLIETTQYQARRERIISSVGTELRSQVLTEQVLKSAVNHIGAQLGASRAAIRLHTELGENHGKELQKA